jgi:hypothetical protein
VTAPRPNRGGNATAAARRLSTETGLEAANPSQATTGTPSSQNPPLNAVKAQTPSFSRKNDRQPLAPDRPSERSERDVVPAQAGAVAPVVLGSSPAVFPVSKSGRKKRYQLRRSLRSVNPARQAKCGHCRIKGTVTVGIKNGRAGFSGLLRCGSVWLCPVCSATIKGERAAEVTALYAWHKKQNQGDVLMLSLTVRHALGDDLKQVRKGVANAWRYMQAGKHWQAIKKQEKLVGYVRALEVTHGAHGWHPHLHILLMLPSTTAAKRVKLRERLSARWQSAVSRALGEKFVPNDHLGTNLKIAEKEDYITKLGLEISDVGTKKGREKNRNPWQIGQDYAETESAEDAALWKAYVEGIRGARMLTWSKGLRKMVGLGREKTDEEIVADSENEATEVLEIDTQSWLLIRDGDIWTLLDAAETYDPQRVQDAFNRLLEWGRRRKESRSKAESLRR